MNELQRVVLISPHVLCVYCDNDFVHGVVALANNPRRLEVLLHQSIGRSVSVVQTMLYYWPRGTHYWIAGVCRPSLSILNPFPGLYLAGEFVSDRQGSIEGALRCVLECIEMNEEVRR